MHVSLTSGLSLCFFGMERRTNRANVDGSDGTVTADIVVEDTANYTCVVSGPHNVVLASVTHLIQVRGLFQSHSLAVSF